MGVETMWAISTAHIMQATTKTLERWAMRNDATDDELTPLIVYNHHEYGWLINVVGLGGERPAIDTVALRDIDAIVTAAIELGVCWVLLDRDADIVRHLPVYDW